jgi:hypothetical protein
VDEHEYVKQMQDVLWIDEVAIFPTPTSVTWTESSKRRKAQQQQWQQAEAVAASTTAASSMDQKFEYARALCFCSVVASGRFLLLVSCFVYVINI